MNKAQRFIIGLCAAAIFGVNLPYVSDWGWLHKRWGREVGPEWVRVSEMPKGSEDALGAVPVGHEDTASSSVSHVRVVIKNTYKDEEFRGVALTNVVLLLGASTLCVIAGKVGARKKGDGTPTPDEPQDA